MRTVGVYAVLLGAAMVASYVTWTTDDGKDADASTGVAVYRAGTGDVKALAWKDEKLQVRVERKQDASGDFVWVTIDETRTKAVPPKPHDHGSPDDPHGDEDHGKDTDAAPDEAGPEPEPEPEVVTTHTEFLGSESASGLFESFEPLMALRELDTAGLDPATLGFDDDPATLTVTRGSGDLAITVGGETYGAKDRYVRSDGKVLLLEDTTVRPLQFAQTRLQETRAHPFAEADLQRVTVARGGASVTLVQQNRADRAAAYWARGGTPEDRDDTADAWIDKLLRLRVQSYPSAEEVPATEPSATIALTDGKASWTLEILKATGSDAWFARSTYNRATVQLTGSLASEAIADLDELFQE